MGSKPAVVEHFHGVYLLYCENPQFLGHTYIGYTVDPNRRIKQHNKGRQAGGAKRTSKKGPWTMVMIIHGFLNDISALRFEWAWQHPRSSRRLRHVSTKRKNEKPYDFRLRVLTEMLLVGPWNRLPLTIRWLNETYARNFQKSPPSHMPICSGPVISKKIPNDNNKSSEFNNKHEQCDICYEPVQKSAKCLVPNCNFQAHLICLSKTFLKGSKNYIPVEGNCLECKTSLLWGDLVRKYKGCFNNLDLLVENRSDDELSCSDSDF